MKDFKTDNLYLYILLLNLVFK